MCPATRSGAQDILKSVFMQRRNLILLGHTVSHTGQFKTATNYGISAAEIYLQKYFSKAKAHDQQLRTQ